MKPSRFKVSHEKALKEVSEPEILEKHIPSLVDSMLVYPPGTTELGESNDSMLNKMEGPGPKLCLSTSDKDETPTKFKGMALPEATMSEVGNKSILNWIDSSPYKQQVIYTKGTLDRFKTMEGKREHKSPFVVKDTITPKRIIQLQNNHDDDLIDRTSSLDRASVLRDTYSVRPEISITYSEAIDATLGTQAVAVAQSEYHNKHGADIIPSAIDIRHSMPLTPKAQPVPLSAASVRAFSHDLMQAKLCRELFDKMIKYGDDLQSRNTFGEDAQDEINFKLYLEEIVYSGSFELSVIRDVALQVLKKLDERRELVNKIKVG